MFMEEIDYKMDLK